MSPEQRRERVQIAGGQPLLPLGPGEHLLDHEGIHVDCYGSDPNRNRGLQAVQVTGAKPGVGGPVATEPKVRFKLANRPSCEAVGPYPTLCRLLPAPDVSVFSTDRRGWRTHFERPVMGRLLDSSAC